MRRVTGTDADRVAQLLALAFYNDPTWSWAFPSDEERLAQHAALWALFVRSAIPYEWVWTTDDGGAVSIWIPPGRPELSPEDEAMLEPMIREQLGAHAGDVLELMQRFEANHPRERPHYYLSFLGTHPDHRGQGKGMGLLADVLAMLDEIGAPAYLESSNRANDHRYERQGFVQIGEFSAPRGGPSLACMWREPR
jgi:GNAT superfamily N-acetyltransferase